MPKRWFHLAACFFICINTVGQEFPFVYYTPRDGLVNNRVRAIKQDSKGRMYFITHGGLSIYDGSRFINYGKQDGLANELVNDVAEMAPDSLLVATNTSQLNTLIRGRIGIYKTADDFYPIINRLIKSIDGYWYVTADEGLFKLVDNRFIRLPFYNKKGMTIQAADKVMEWNNYLLIIPWNINQPEKLILYDRQNQQVTDIYTQERVFSTARNQKGQLLITTAEGVKRIDPVSLQLGLLRLLPLPPGYNDLVGWKNAFVAFDKADAAWLYSNNRVIRISPDGEQQVIAAEQGLKMGNLSDIFIDREGTTWMASDGNGVVKMTGTNIQILNSFLPGHGFNITAIHQQEDTTWLFNVSDNSVYRICKNQLQSFQVGGKKLRVGNIYMHGQVLYLADTKNIFYINDKNSIAAYRHPAMIHFDKDVPFEFVNGIGDNKGAIILYSTKNNASFYLSVLYEKKIVMEYKLSYPGDQLAIDNRGWLWAATRDDHLMVFSLHPEKPSEYLRLLHDFSKEIAGMGPRSITVDKDRNVWIGTRNNGLYCLKFDGLQFRTAQQFTTRQGLTDNFIYGLYCDSGNTIWAGTQTGLDKIFLKNGRYIIENVTRNKNIYQTIYRMVTAADNRIWALGSDGNILKVSAEPASTLASPPPLLLTSMMVNDEEQADTIHDFPYHQNNFSFTVAAPSFINERSIRYSYLLKGSSKKNWSEPSTDTRLNFINLAPGEYELAVKAEFPALLYPPQALYYPFNIHPPYWQTWWFRTLSAIAILALIYFIVRAYYLRILDKKQMQFEQQQALEKERTRIATDMHDDLGAGLSKIRFLSETVQRNITEQAHQSHLQNIVSSSIGLVDKFNEIIWAMNEKNNSLEDLLYYIRSYTARYGEENGLDYQIYIPEIIPAISISGEMRRHIFLTVKECLHNIIKHAAAKNIGLRVELEDRITIIIHDDGKGFDITEMKNSGNGLRNMEQRIRIINGTLDIESKTGTLVKITIPFPLPGNS